MKNQQVAITDPDVRSQALAHAQQLLSFLDRSPCNLHAVEALGELFADAGFSVLQEDEPFSLQPGGRYVLQRHGTALLAMVVGNEAPSKAGFRIVGAHTDSPGFRVKPYPETTSQGLVHLGVEVYGGPLVATWTDRDLGLCGRVAYQDEQGEVRTRLYRSRQPLLSLPNIAIHQNREANDKGLKLNPQTEVTPILGSLAEGLPEEDALRGLLAEALDIPADGILDFDLYLYDTQPGSFSGAHGEFLRCGRLDDLAMCHAAATALTATADAPGAQTRIAVFYDSEEVGSQTAAGARSTLLPSSLERIALALGDDRGGYLAALASSFLISADNAHAIHPGYASKQDPGHAPVLNGGPVIKTHASRAYATDGYSSAVFELACRRAGVPLQRFVNRSDVKSGGTIGSMTAAQLGILTVDVGSAQYAMHSVREMAGTWDHHYMTEAMKSFYLG